MCFAPRRCAHGLEMTRDLAAVRDRAFASCHSSRMLCNKTKVSFDGSVLKSTDILFTCGSNFGNTARKLDDHTHIRVCKVPESVS